MTRVVRRPVPAIVDSHWPDHIPPLLRRIYATRGAQHPDEARPRLAHLPSPDLMGGIAAATALLADAIIADRHILVVGDFDCDGATACAVAVRGLRMLGARRVSHAVPDRIVHGYGLSPALVEELAPLAPDLLVTVDHGIACHAGIAAAKARGWKVLVTDHHLPGAELPPADVIVNPNLPGDGFPSRMLAGVGVVFYVLLALRGAIGSCDRPGRGDQEAAIHGRGSHQQPPDLSVLLDLVAVGTIADLVPLDAVNRALAGAGLRRIRAGQACHGVRALLEVAGVRTACRVFQGWMALNGFDERGWVKRFTAHGRPGPYLRVLEEGVVERGDPIGVEHRPAHGTTVGTMFLALTTERHLLSGLQPVEGPTLAFVALPAAFTVPTGRAHWEVLLRARAPLGRGAASLDSAPMSSRPRRLSAFAQPVYQIEAPAGWTMTTKPDGRTGASTTRLSNGAIVLDATFYPDKENRFDTKEKMEALMRAIEQQHKRLDVVVTAGALRCPRSPHGRRWRILRGCGPWRFWPAARGSGGEDGVPSEYAQSPRLDRDAETRSAPGGTLRHHAGSARGEQGTPRYGRQDRGPCHRHVDRAERHHHPDRLVLPFSRLT